MLNGRCRAPGRRGSTRFWQTRTELPFWLTASPAKTIRRLTTYAFVALAVRAAQLVKMLSHDRVHAALDATKGSLRRGGSRGLSSMTVWLRALRRQVRGSGTMTGPPGKAPGAKRSLHP
jgi:hypothetical protein